MSLVNQILERFRTKPGVWVAGGAIERWTLENTKYTASNARRRLRELVEDGALMQDERQLNGKNHAFYCYQPEVSTAKKAVYSYEFNPYTERMEEKVSYV